MAEVKNSPQRADIQALRGLAVAAVVLFHAKKDLFSNGYLGVDAFFVISGCLIINKFLKIQSISKSCSTKETLNQLRIFWIKRYLRLFPALNVVLAFTVLFTFLFANPFEFRRIILQAIGGFLSIANFTASKTSQNYFNSTPNPNIHLWSTSTEIQVYMFCTFLFCIILLFKRFKESNLKFYFYTSGIISILLFIKTFVVSDIENQATLEVNNYLNYYAPLNRLWEIIIPGMFFAKFKSNLHNSLLAKKICFSFIVLITLVPYKLPAGISILVIVFSSTFYLILPANKISFSNKYGKILIWLGDRAYSIFLIHLPLFYFTRYSPLINIQNKTFPMLISLALLLPLAQVLYHGIEINFVRYDLVKENRKKLISIHMITLLLLGGSYNIISSNKISGGYLAEILKPSNEIQRNTDWDPRCKLTYNRQAPCKYIINVGTGKNIYIIGDSTAAVSASYVVFTAKKYNWNTYAWNSTGCPMFIPKEAIQFSTETKFELNSSNQDCIDLNQKRFMWIKANKPSLLVIQSRASDYYALISNGISIKELIASSINQLSPSVDKIIFVLPNPEFEPFVISQWNEKNKITELPKSPFTDQEFFLRYNFAPNVVLIDSIRNLCNLKECSMLDNGKSIYSDLYHLNKSGAAKNLSEFEIILKRLALI